MKRNEGKNEEEEDGDGINYGYDDMTSAEIDKIMPRCYVKTGKPVLVLLLLLFVISQLNNIRSTLYKHEKRREEKNTTKRRSLVSHTFVLLVAS